MAPPMTLQAIQALRPGSSRLLTGGMIGLLSVGLNRPGRRVRFELEGWENLPTGPSVIVANHTHWLDWIGLRWVCWWRGVRLCNWVKPRTYEEGWSTFLNQSGNIPVASRGYLLAADFRAVHGRAPDETEYRTLRDHIDLGTPLPEGPIFEPIRDRAREILGVGFDPSEADYRACIDDLFFRMMSATVDHTRTLCDQGIHLQIMPQGVTSIRLTAGHPGALQAALALGLPLVPAGINGFPQAWGGKHLFPREGGVVRVRLGEAWPPDPIPGHTPFLPSSERTHADALAAGTERMMGRIAALLDPEHRQGAEDHADVEGVARFV